MEATLPDTGLPPALLPALAEQLCQPYGERFHALVLYGSRARGDWDAGSDVDLLLLLEGEVDPFADFRLLGDITYPFELAHALVITVLPVSSADFEESRSAVIREARAEGYIVPCRALTNS